MEYRLMNQPRQCPGCKTWYAPHVEKCECGKISGVIGRIVGPGDVCLPTDKIFNGNETPCTNMVLPRSVKSENISPAIDTMV